MQINKKERGCAEVEAMRNWFARTGGERHDVCALKIKLKTVLTDV